MSSHYCGVSVHFTFSEENAKKIQDVLQPALNAYPGIQSTLLVNVTPVWGDETLQLRIDCESPETREAFKARHWNIPGITREALDATGIMEKTQADYGPYWKRPSPPVENEDTDSNVVGTGFNEAFGGW